MLASDVNLTTNTGVAGDIQIHFQGPVDSDGTPRALELEIGVYLCDSRCW